MNLLKLKRQSRRGIYHSMVEYWVSIRDIQIPASRSEEHISERKIKRERNYYRTFGLYETRILLNRNFVLMDGYISILIAKEEGELVVPVYFIYTDGKAVINED